MKELDYDDIGPVVDDFWNALHGQDWQCDDEGPDEIIDELHALIKQQQTPANLKYVLETDPALKT